jgi:hypothetical protein
MKTILKSALAGIASGLLVFVTAGWAVSSALWWYAGMDKVQAGDNPGVVLGGVWCVTWGIISGGILAVVTLVFVSRYVYRRAASL